MSTDHSNGAPARPNDDRPTLTLLHGDGQAEYVEHPLAVAKRALQEAARLETASETPLGSEWGYVLTRMASALPDRPAIVKREVA